MSTKIMWTKHLYNREDVKIKIFEFGIYGEDLQFGPPYFYYVLYLVLFPRKPILEFFKNNFPWTVSKTKVTQQNRH